ncbi:MAG TPA: 23S rRNA (pseudouridine(1915)-N(3))-methyltransferase RlmH, partial [Bacteroidales bacterium]|nr:23S rRNA (pseudouridine(1915)-N(3))-methyltransferase RlmH [Bacteroidales bacterium]
FLSERAVSSDAVTFVIGGSLGLPDELIKGAQLNWSFSKLTFPHQLFRIMLLEQIYRAVKINRGGKYHK